MAEQTLGDRDERLAANFDGTEFTECFPTSQGVSFRSKLGTAASRDVTTSATDTTAGRLLKVGDGGLLNTQIGPSMAIKSDPMGSSIRVIPSDDPDRIDTDAWRSTAIISRSFEGGAVRWTGLLMRNGSNSRRAWIAQYISTSSPDLTSEELYHTGNTTVDSNGFIKEASPIIRLFATGEIEEPSQPTNAKVTRKSTGHYEITGTLGFAKKGWYIETPKDANGSIKVLTEYSQDKKGKITVKTYEPTGQGWRPEKGDPIDIPDGRWIDIRLEAPEPAPEPEAEETDAQ